MKVNARTEEFQHIEAFDKPALFTNGRIARDTIPAIGTQTILRITVNWQITTTNASA